MAIFIEKTKDGQILPVPNVVVRDVACGANHTVSFLFSLTVQNQPCLYRLVLGWVSALLGLNVIRLGEFPIMIS